MMSFRSNLAQHPLRFSSKAAGFLAIVSSVLMAIFESAHAHPGDGLIVTDDGTAYFGFIDPFVGASHFACIWRVTGAGEAVPFHRSEHNPSNLWMSRSLDGRLYVAENRYFGELRGQDIFEATISSVSGRGEVQQIFGPLRGRLAFGAGAYAAYRDDAVVVANDAITLQWIRPDEPPRLLAGGESGHADGVGANARFTSISRMAWGPRETLYVQDGRAIRTVTLNGAVSTLTTRLGQLASDAPVLPGRTAFMDMDVDASGTVYGADYFNRRVLQISAEGSVTVVYLSEPPWSPEGVAVHGTSLYVLESTTFESQVIRPRLRVLHADGTVSTVFQLPG